MAIDPEDYIDKIIGGNKGKLCIFDNEDFYKIYNEQAKEVEALTKLKIFEFEYCDYVKFPRDQLRYYLNKLSHLNPIVIGK